MTRPRSTPAAQVVTALVLEVFRFNGRLLAMGDRLVAGLGLTSARWQVLGAIALSPAAQPVAHLARAMGLNRQGVQRIVNELAAEGIVAFRPNPHHRRARLVELTPRGSEVYDAAGRLWAPAAERMARQLQPADIAIALRVIGALRQRLEGETSDELREHE